MGAHFFDFTLIQHHNFVGFADGGKPVGNHNGGPSGNQGINGMLDELFGTGIHRRSGFVENQNGWIIQQCPNKGKQLSLAQRKGAAPLHNIIMVPAG